MSQKRLVLILSLFCIPLFFLNVQNTHSYGDDWAQYLQEALNIAQGRPYYLSSWVFNPLNTTYAPPFYPPGYPLLLAPIVKFTGTSILPILYFNSVLLCVLLFAAYYYFSRHTQKLTALCLAIIFTYIFELIDLKGQILSDIPCTVFTLLYLGVRENEKPWHAGKILLLSFLAAFAMLFRTQAVVILFAEIFLLVLSLWKRQETMGKNRFYLSGPLLVVISTAVFYLLSILFFLPAPAGGLRFYIHLYKNVWEGGSVWKLIGSNANYLFGLLNEVFCHKMNDPFLQFIVSLVTTSSIFLALAGGLKMLRERLSFSLVFFFMMCLLILTTPVHQGLRYLLPAVPVFILLVARGVKAVVPVLLPLPSRYVAVSCLLIFLVLGYDDNEKKMHADNGPTVNHLDSAAFAFVRNHVGQDEIVLYTKPRLLALYTGKKTMNVSWQKNAMENKEHFDSLGVNYLLYCAHLNFDVVSDYLRLEPRPYSDSVVINELYTFYYLKNGKQNKVVSRQASAE